MNERVREHLKKYVIAARMSRLGCNVKTLQPAVVSFAFQELWNFANDGVYVYEIRSWELFYQFCIWIVIVMSYIFVIHRSLKLRSFLIFRKFKAS